MTESAPVVSTGSTSDRPDVPQGRPRVGRRDRGGDERDPRGIDARVTIEAPAPDQITDWAIDGRSPPDALVRGHDKVPTDGHEEVPTLDLISEPG
jgi:hypothetical protein